MSLGLPDLRGGEQVEAVRSRKRKIRENVIEEMEIKVIHRIRANSRASLEFLSHMESSTPLRPQSLSKIRETEESIDDTGAGESTENFITARDEIEGALGDVDGRDDLEGRPLQELVAEVESILSRYFNLSPNNAYQSVSEVVKRCIRTSSEIYGESEAREWAKGFTFDSNRIQNDINLYEQCGHDIATMAKVKQDALRPGRLHLRRLESLSPDNPELNRLKSLCHGIITPKPEGFHHNAPCNAEIWRRNQIQKAFFIWSEQTDHRPELSFVRNRTKTSSVNETRAINPVIFPAAELYQEGFHRSYSDTFPAVDKMLGDLHNQGLGIIIPRSLLQQHSSIHINLAKWAKKKRKRSGRNITDLSFCKKPRINGEWAKAAAAEMYGEVKHPTITDIVLMILKVLADARSTNPLIQLEDLRFWKVDVSGAYTWLDFQATDVDDKVFLSLVGVFGASILPACFNVVTRAYRFEIKRFTKGGADVYVDDGYGCCLVEFVVDEMKRAKTIFEGIVGEDCIKEEKNEVGLVVDALGWKIDLKQGIIAISDNNAMQALLCIFSINLDSKITLVKLQRLSSYCSRYVIILEVLRPFLACLHRMMGGANQHSSLTFTDEAKWAVRMWRAVFYLLIVDEGKYGRPMASFQPRDPEYIIETDGSLSQVGIILYKNSQSGETCIGGGGQYLGFRIWRSVKEPKCQ